MAHNSKVRVSAWFAHVRAAGVKVRITRQRMVGIIARHGDACIAAGVTTGHPRLVLPRNFQFACTRFLFDGSSMKRMHQAVADRLWMAKEKPLCIVDLQLAQDLDFRFILNAFGNDGAICFFGKPNQRSG